MELTPALYAGMHGMPPVDVPETELHSILYIKTTPYDPNGWTEALHRCNLSHEFLNLINDITFGSPIGNPPPLSKTFLL